MNVQAAVNDQKVSETMDARRWKQVNDLLDAALTLPASVRETYLQEQCGDDAALLQEVESLLRANDDANSFLEEPAKDYAATLLDNSSQDPLLGQEIDGYRILDVLGQGGMGIVYKVKNLALDRFEALKVITPSLVRDAQFLRRFQQEAQTLARIHHANIVTIYTLRESELGHYLTMEFVEGETLADILIEQGPLSWQAMLPLVKQLLSGFEAAHSRGIIHRDIKPRNIMLTPGRQIKVMDFGLAKFYQQHDMTMTQGVAGTPFYMSPEQVTGRRLDQRSDIFSLGMTLYELLSGQLPFNKQESLFSIQRAIVEVDFPAPNHFNSKVPKRLSDMLMKALEKDPDRRYTYAREMLSDIEAFGSSIYEMPTIAEGAVAATSDDTVDVAALPLAYGALQQTAPAREAIPPSSWKERVLAYKDNFPSIGWLVLAGGLALGVYGIGLFAFDWMTTPEENGDPVTEEVADANNPTASGLPLADSTSLGPLANSGDFGSAIPDPQNGLDILRDASSVPSQQEEIRREQTPQTQPTTPQRDSGNQTPQNNDETASSSTPNKETATSQQNSTEETASQTQPETSSTNPPETQPPPEQPEVNPEEMALQSTRALRDKLKDAIMTASWAGMPSPVAAFYQEKLKGLSKKFEIINVGVVIDDSAIRNAGPDVTLPITVHVSFRQKGQDRVNSLPIPSTWRWQESGGTMTLVNVQ
jgi:serine/threonine protein kinase